MEENKVKIVKCMDMMSMEVEDVGDITLHQWHEIIGWVDGKYKENKRALLITGRHCGEKFFLYGAWIDDAYILSVRVNRFRTTKIIEGDDSPICTMDNESILIGSLNFSLEGRGE